MKHLFLSLALIAIALPFTSCSDDKNEPISTPVTLVGNKMLNATIKIADNSVNYVESANYSFVITPQNNDNPFVKVKASGIKFDSHMPVKVSFDMEDIKAKTTNDDYIIFEAPTAKIYDTSGNEITNYAITNVKGCIANTFIGCYALEYTVNGTWRVMACSNNLLTKVTDNNYDGNELFYSYALDVDDMKAEVYIFNVQFQVGGASSPTLKKISIPDLDINVTASGIELTGDGIVPTYYTGANLDQATPYPALTVTNFKSTLNLRNGDHNIFFNCHDGEHKVTDKRLFLWN